MQGLGNLQHSMSGSGCTQEMSIIYYVTMTILDSCLACQWIALPFYMPDVHGGNLVPSYVDRAMFPCLDAGICVNLHDPSRCAVFPLICRIISCGNNGSAALL